ncbi:MAG: Fe-S oxidoreductase [Thermoanaerobaculia bacterium]|nr:Fe-S oxidoreductase [Thermoanaerobaculia bacterium]
MKPVATHRESERLPGGPPWRTAPALTVFLYGATCPFACVFCDLAQHTHPGPTPPGALPAQLAAALAENTPAELAGTTLKLYNASNFFAPRAVPTADLPALARLAAPCARVVVENHPRLVGDPAREFADALGGARLEVALGLETIHPEAFPRLGKGMRLGDFDRAAEFLVRHGLGLRVFVLVGGLFFPVAEATEWAVRSAEYALAAGADHVSLIPLRPPAGQPELQAPRLADLEDALDALLAPAAKRGAVVTVDGWDLERLAACPGCFAARRERLVAVNVSGEAADRVNCAKCGGVS